MMVVLSCSFFCHKNFSFSSSSSLFFFFSARTFFLCAFATQEMAHILIRETIKDVQWGRTETKQNCWKRKLSSFAGLFYSTLHHWNKQKMVVRLLFDSGMKLTFLHHVKHMNKELRKYIKAILNWEKWMVGDIWIGRIFWHWN